MAEGELIPADAQPAWAELIVPQRHVKRVKTVLEERKLLNKTKKIAPHGSATKTWNEPHMSIYTNIPLPMQDELGIAVPMRDPESLREYDATFKQLDLDDIRDDIKATSYPGCASDLETPGNNPVLKALKKSFDTLPQELLDSIGISADELISGFPASYTIYRPLLLLPHNAFALDPRTKPRKAQILYSSEFQPFWERVAAVMGVTHIAVNAGIPPQTSSTPSDANSETIPNENILRSPTNLTPIYGDFGPPPSAQTLSSPSATDFDNALWVQHTQNGIHQTWAPLYTMFSRGNIREKSRVLTLPSVTTSVAEPRGCTAVDLYAGIGYFAFSYKKAGVSKVLCWELNPWSIEGLKRGAKMNGWRTQVIERRDAGSEPDRLSESSDFVIFARSNEYALDDVRYTQRFVKVPPVRHVNCGFLPSSKLSWKTSVELVDRELGGWIHAHENVGVNDLETRKAEVVTEMKGYLDNAGLSGEVRCEHVEKVKTYAPGVLHVVFDVWIGATRSIASNGT